MAKVTWLTLDAAYKEYYGKELPEVPKTKSTYRSRFKKGLISNKIPLHDGTIQVSKESIEAFKMKYSSIRYSVLKE